MYLVYCRSYIEVQLKVETENNAIALKYDPKTDNLVRFIILVQAVGATIASV